MKKREPEHVREFIRDIHAKCAGVIGAATVPILAPSPKDRTPILAGTGVLLRVEEEHFIITASHVADVGTKNGFDLAVPGIGNPPPLVSLAGSKIFKTVAPPGSEDLHDMAAILLNNGHVDRILPGKTALTLDQLAPGHTPALGCYYAIVGFPEELRFNVPERNFVITPPSPYGTTPYLGDLSQLPKFDPTIRIAFQFDPDMSISDDGARASTPEPYGISGCGIWKLFCRKTIPGRSWSPDEIKLVGIEHHWYPGFTALVGTKIRWAIQVLYEKRPDLRKSIERAFSAKEE